MVNTDILANGHQKDQPKDKEKERKVSKEKPSKRSPTGHGPAGKRDPGTKEDIPAVRMTCEGIVEKTIGEADNGRRGSFRDNWRDDVKKLADGAVSVELLEFELHLRFFARPRAVIALFGVFGLGEYRHGCR